MLTLLNKIPKVQKKCLTTNNQKKFYSTELYNCNSEKEFQQPVNMYPKHFVDELDVNIYAETNSHGSRSIVWILRNYPIPK